VTAEPDMESLLASIRTAIDSDIGKNTRPSSAAPVEPPFRGSIRELRANYDDHLRRARDSSAERRARDSSGEISDLRNKIQKNRLNDGYVEPAPRLPIVASPAPKAPDPESRTGFAGILGGDATDIAPWAPHSRRDLDAPGLRPSILDREQDYQANLDGAQVYPDEVGWAEEEPAYLPSASLMSASTADAANSSFNQLADTLMARALGERTIEDMTQDLLKGMLRSWLDAHLPSLVEKLVREEIDRVARRGR
jgi:cell pole-organizing protein PopZ